MKVGGPGGGWPLLGDPPPGEPAKQSLAGGCPRGGTVSLGGAIRLGGVVTLEEVRLLGGVGDLV